MHALLLGELQSLAAIARTKTRDSRSYLIHRKQGQRDAPVIALEVLVGKIIRWDPTKFDELDRMEIVVPLLDIVRMENSGKVTGEALDVLNKLLVHGIFTLKAKNSISAVSEIAESLSQCKFEAMENGKDELVLNKLLNVQLTCIFTECGSYLTDHAIWEMFQTSFRIFSEMKPPEYSELLSDCAQHTLMEMTRIIFQRLKISEPDGLIPDRFHETNYDYHLQSFGIPCMIKVFSTLCTSWASKSKDGNANLQSSNSKEYVYVNTLILRLICCALEEAGVLWTRVPSLVSLVKDDVCALLLRSSKTNDPIALCLILRVFYDILLICRDQLKVQIEVIINSIYMRLYMPLRSPKFSHEERASVRLGNQTLRIDSPDDLSSEIVFILLDGLCNLCRLPNFYRELFLNYDCDPKCTNVFHNITKVFCQYAVPLQDEFSHLHEVALNGLMAIISSFQLIPSLNDSDELLEECNRILEIRNQKETLAEAIEVFNQNPKKGIAKLLESKLISGNEDAEGVANLLRFTFGFSKPKIGEFLGADDPFATQIRQKFIEKFDYRNRRIDEAVRMTIEVLELPKEAQQIDRIINAISAHFFEQNKNLFSNADVVYFLTFSLLMLHTDAWSHKVKNKMSLDDWFRIHRDVNAGSPLPKDYLKKLYVSVTTNEFKVSESGFGGFVTETLWVDLVTRSSSSWGLNYSKTFHSKLESELFLEIWSPSLAALLVGFNASSDRDLVDSIAAAIVSISKIASSRSLYSVVDEVVQCVYRVSGLSSSDMSHENLLYEFGQNYRYQVAIKMLHRFLGDLSSSFRNCWANYLSLLFNLLRFQFLNRDDFALDDFLDGNLYPPRSLTFATSADIGPTKINSFFSAMQSFFAKDEEPIESNSGSAYNSLKNRSIHFIHELNLLPSFIIQEAKFMETESFYYLLNSVLILFGEKYFLPPSLISSESSMKYPVLSHIAFESQKVFHLQILSDIVCQNADRAESILPTVFDLCHDLIGKALNENMEFLHEAAIVSFFKISSKITSEFSTCSRFVSKICSVTDLSEVPPRSSLQFYHGLLSFLKSSLKEFDDIDLISSILNSCKAGFQSEITFDISVRIINHFIQNLLNSTWISTCGVGFFVDILLEALLAAQSANVMLEIVLGWFKILTRSMENLEKLLGKKDKTDEQLWMQIRFPILHGVSSLCAANVAWAREQSLDFMHDALLLMDVSRFQEISIRGVFKDVLLLIMSELSSDDYDLTAYSKSRVLIAKLVCKVFLVYLPELSKHEDMFLDVSSSIFESLSKFSKLDRDIASSLNESLHESIRNVILVMQSSDLLSSKNPSDFQNALSTKIWTAIDNIYPSLKTELNPQ